MKLTRATDYALFVTAHLATLERGEITSIRAVVSEYDIPERFLANIVNKLAGAGIIASMKGVNGGIRLARDAAQITVLQVVESMEKSLALVKCQSAEPFCPLVDSCLVKGLMDHVYQEMRETLGRTSIADLKFYADRGKVMI